MAWRCFEKRPNTRSRFAHTAPWHFEIPRQPLRPRRAEIDWLVANVKAEIARSQGIAPEALISDYRRALEIYEKLARTAEISRDLRADVLGATRQNNDPVIGRH